MSPAQHIQRPPLEGMALTNDGYLVGIASEVVGDGQSVEWSFDSLDRPTLMKMLQKRVADGSILRLVGKCLHVGVLDGQEFSEPSEGTVQGSTLSPLLGNVYLHYVLDLWFEEEVLPRLKGKAKFIRYADDGVFGFELEEDARRVQAVLGKRLERFGLTLHPDKTRLLEFSRPPPARTGGRSPTTFDFLGFTWYWRRNPEASDGRSAARPGVRAWREPYGRSISGARSTGTCPSKSSTRRSRDE